MVSIFWAVELVLIMSKTIVKISDVAKLAGVSSSTASFVLNGHGDAMHISKETQEKVWSAAKHLNYSYGSSPPRVRKVKTTGLPAITIFWTADRNFSNMTRAFISLQQSIFKKQLNAEVVLKPFVSKAYRCYSKKCRQFFQRCNHRRGTGAGYTIRRRDGPSNPDCLF